MSAALRSGGFSPLRATDPVWREAGQRDGSSVRR